MGKRGIHNFDMNLQANKSLDLILDVRDIEVKYSHKQVIFGVSMYVKHGQFISIIGHNGAGKTTILKSIFGLLNLVRGVVIFEGQNINNRSVSENVKEGISFVHQEKAIFSNLSVSENLELGSFILGKSFGSADRIKHIYQYFPILEERKKQLANTLSGGEQKMLAIGMALITKPKLLLLDEPSLGLAPVLVKELGKLFKRIQSTGTAILLVEQNVKMAISLAERIYVIKMGRIFHEDTHENMSKRADLWDLF